MCGVTNDQLLINSILMMAIVLWRDMTMTIIIIIVAKYYY